MLAHNEANLIWIDLEMTGLEIETNRIIEIATVVTDPDLKVLEEGPVFAIRQPQTLLDNMNDWCKKQHGKSGLTQRVEESNISEQQAENETIAFLKQYVPENASPMCGNSICQDRRFLARYMPKLEQYFHYRHIDVSTLKELAHRWKPELMEKMSKKSRHLALDDIHDSIQELAFYRDNFLNC